PWVSLVCNINIQDMAVASSQVVFVINSAGVVSKSVNNGLLWNTTSSTNLTSGATLVAINTNTVFAGSQDGYVSYTLNGGTSWTRITQKVETLAGNVQVAADANFATNKIIYAASDTPGSNIMKWTIGTSIVWTDIFFGAIAGGVFSLVASDNVLYALEYNAATQRSTLWRLLSPATAVLSSAEWTFNIADIGVQLDAAPQALRTSTEKLWAVNTNTAIGSSKLYSYSDVIIDVQIALLSPQDGYLVNVNSISFTAYDVSFSWERPSVATRYQLLIAQDINFTMLTANISVNMSDEIVYVTLGPSQIGVNHVDFAPEVTYYWKVRVTKPGYSPYSVTRHFTIDHYPPTAVETITLVTTDPVLSASPTLSWLPLQGISEYEFRLSNDPDMASPVIDSFTRSTAFVVDTTLDYGETYFWQVRASSPKKSPWSRMGVFTVTDQPMGTPPLFIIEQAPAQTSVLTLTAPPETNWSISFLQSIVTPGYLHVIFLLILVAIGFTVFLIRRNATRQLVAVPQEKRSILSFLRTIMPGVKTARPEPKPTPRAEIPKIIEEPERPAPGIEMPIAPAAPEKTAPHPSLMEKDKAGATVIFAAKSFMWMATQPDKTDLTQTGLPEKERQSLGRKLATKIHELTRKQNLYLKYPEDAPMLLGIWAEYGSRHDTSNYLTKSFELNPYNAIKLIKCYLPAAQPGKEPPGAFDFTMVQYANVTEVVEPDNVYAALTNLFKFQADNIEERVPVAPSDRNLAFQFMRLHHEAKGGKITP
ncbi:MAG: hypothetical protein ACYDG5_08545, partial [Dehalococcoidales bacterium]